MEKKRRAQLNKEDDGEEGGDDWLLTYGDLMTQLVCFFVLLMSFSVVNAMKFRDVVVSLHDALSGQGILTSHDSAMSDMPLGYANHRVQDERLMELQEEIEETLEELDMSAHVEIEMRDEGLVIILKQRNPPVFFDTADARVKEQAYPILDQIGMLIAALPNKISVEGEITPIEYTGLQHLCLGPVARKVKYSYVQKINRIALADDKVQRLSRCCLSFRWGSEKKVNIGGNASSPKSLEHQGCFFDNNAFIQLVEHILITTFQTKFEHNTP